MRPARKVFTESMVRKVLQFHFEIEPGAVNMMACDCGWETTVGLAEQGKAFEDHFIDQLHKTWHETVGRRKLSSTQVTPVFNGVGISPLGKTPTEVSIGR